MLGPASLARLLALTQILGVCARHECIHDSHIVPRLLSHEHFPATVPQEPSGAPAPPTNASEQARRRLVAGGSRFRIHVDYAYLDADRYLCRPGDGHADSVSGGNRVPCTRADYVDGQKKAKIKEVVEAARRWFEQTLRVLHPPRGELRLKKYCYQYAPPPNRDPDTPNDRTCFGGGGACDFRVDADYYLVVTAHPTAGSTVAWALACQNDRATGRPVAGLINFGPARLSMAPSRWRSEFTTALHEVAHALGFSASSYDHFIDAQGERLGRDRVVRQFQRRGKATSKVVTPRVVDAVKRQYGCFDWPDAGGELEDHGGRGTAGSHWEKRTFRNEFMTGTGSRDPVLSAVTLALFEDTGWYQADYSAAERLDWGRGAGCAFSAQTCDHWEERYFCTEAGAKSCTHDRLFKGYCNLNRWRGDLPAHHRYFPSSPSWGGRDAHADYCPFYEGYGNRDCRRPEHATKASAGVWGERHGQGSRCFDSTVISRDYKPPDSGGRPFQRCYALNCTDGGLTVYVGDTPLECPRGGGRLRDVGRLAPGFEGDLWCPPAAEVCSGAAGDLDFDGRPALPFRRLEVTELEVGGAPKTVKLLAGGSQHLLADLSEPLTGGLALRVRGAPEDARAFLYVRAGELLRPEPQAGEPSAAGPPDVRVRWPSHLDSDASAEVRGGMTELALGSGLQEAGSLLLATLVSPAHVAEASVQLVARCARPCLNGGTCSARGACECPPAYAGLACEERRCPNDCSGHGKCDTGVGSCACDFEYSGERCEVHAPVQSRPNGGEVAVGAWAYFFVACSGPTRGAAGSARLTYTMHRASGSLSDPLLHVSLGRELPTQTSYAARDFRSWLAGSSDHTVQVPVRLGPQGGATVGIFNSPVYATEPLRYTGRLSCVLPGEPRPCPYTRAGACNGRGSCRLAREENAMRCNCSGGWVGPACDEVVLQQGSGQTTRALQLGGAEAIFLSVGVLSSVLGARMRLAIQGAEEFLSISVNAGGERPQPDAPRSASYHNYWSRYSWKPSKASELTIPRVLRPRYTVMIKNPSTSSVRFTLLMTATPRGSALVLASEGAEEGEDAEEEEVLVPLSAVGPDGRLPTAMLVVSSRMGVEGVAGSSMMQLIQVGEFCSRAKSGLYIQCSKMEGTVTVCADQPAVVFHEAVGDRPPKDVAGFRQRQYTAAGRVPRFWPRMRLGSEDCNFHLQVPVGKGDKYIGIAAAQRGQYASFQATMQGRSGFFFDDTGALRTEYPITATAIASSTATACIMTVFFGIWYRKRRVVENAQKFAARLRQTVAMRHRQATVRASGDIRACEVELGSSAAVRDQLAQDTTGAQRGQ